MASFIQGRDFRASPSKEQIIDIVQSWYGACTNRHVNCAQSGHEVSLPSRLIDVGSSEDCARMPRLFIPTKGTLGKYLALSYCWGEQAGVRLTRPSFPRFLTEGIPLNHLPRTLRDACILCRALRIRFLWIDCLCIVQDSEEGWEQQSSMMGAIYSRAVCTIRAAAGADSNHGLFTNRVRQKETSVQVKCLAPNGLVGTCSVRGELYRSSSNTGPLDQRGWALQESLLASRNLVSGLVEMSWECCQGYWNESGTSTEILIPATTAFPLPVRTKQKFTSYDYPESERLTGSEPVLSTWKLIISDYSRRNLTFEKDKFVGNIRVSLAILHGWPRGSRHLSRRTVEVTAS
jgi:Heterokaryon incompatibility protein (HET)